MNDIDSMDMLGFIRMRAYKAQKEHDDKVRRSSKPAYIDEVWPGLRTR